MASAELHPKKRIVHQVNEFYKRVQKPEISSFIANQLVKIRDLNLSALVGVA